MSDRTTNVPTVTFLNVNCRNFKMLKSPLNPEHAPGGLDVEGGFALLLSLFFCLAISMSRTASLTSATRSKSQ